MLYRIFRLFLPSFLFERFLVMLSQLKEDFSFLQTGGLKWILTSRGKPSCYYWPTFCWFLIPWHRYIYIQDFCLGVNSLFLYRAIALCRIFCSSFLLVMLGGILTIRRSPLISADLQASSEAPIKYCLYSSILLLGADFEWPLLWGYGWYRRREVIKSEEIKEAYILNTKYW